MRPASLCLWRNRGMAVSGWIGVALAATPHAEQGCDNKPLMRAMRGGRYPGECSRLRGQENEAIVH